MKRLIATMGMAVSGLALMGATPASATYGTPAPYDESDFAKVRKLDAHVHANLDDPAFLAAARQDNFELLSINVDYPDFPPLAEQARISEKLHRQDPGRFHYVTTFTMSGFGTPGWSEQTKGHLDQAFGKGAVGVKIWKNVGMVERDPAGRRIFLDDTRFDGVMGHLESLGMPLIAHQGEPKNCWLPLEEMTTENDRSYFKAHPEYYMYLHPEEPSYETLMASRDRFLASHPELRFDAAHMASLEWSVDELARFLDQFPNAVVDLAARMSEVQNQSVKDRAKVRAFFVTYQDRLMYGTDLTQNPPEPDARVQNPPTEGDFGKEADQVWRADWRYLATPHAQRVDAIDATAEGLALPRSVIDKIYYSNARRFFRLGS